MRTTFKACEVGRTGLTALIWQTLLALLQIGLGCQRSTDLSQSTLEMNEYDFIVVGGLFHPSTAHI